MTGETTFAVIIQAQYCIAQLCSGGLIVYLQRIDGGGNILIGKNIGR